MKKLIKICIRFLGLLAIVFVLLAAILFGVDYYLGLRGFPVGVIVGNQDVSSLSTEAAIEKLRSAGIKEVFAPQVTFEAKNVRFTFSPEEAGISLNAQQSIGQALIHLGGMDYIKSFRARFFDGEIHYAPIVSLDEEKLRDLLNIIALDVDRSSKEASIKYYEETGGYNILASQDGRLLLIEESIKNVKRGIEQVQPVFKLAILYEPPLITEKMLRDHPPVYRLSKYTTYYGAHDSRNRISNIKLIASWMDNTLLMPGEVFSAVEQIGDFTPQRGFKKAYVISGSELEPQLGGGACQIGTTLYNAASLADLDILQRRGHSFYFNIYPLGRDAGIYPPFLDMKFKNSTEQPILIKTKATNRYLSFAIYGTPTGKEVKFYWPSIQMLNEDGEWVKASYKTVIDADRPFKTAVKREVYDKESGQLLEEEIINSYYKLYGDKDNVPIKKPDTQ